jgi:hypothetical protein
MPTSTVSAFKWIACFVLASTPLTHLLAEAHCPGNVASVPFHLINRHKIILPVLVNHSGPYNFLLDTGTEISMVDSALAADLHLSGRGVAVVAGAGSRQTASFTRVDSIATGSHAAANADALIYALGNLEAGGLTIQGILGEDFLERFDMLIDNAHGLLCLDDSGAMAEAVKGPRVALEPQPAPGKDGDEAPHLLILEARLSDASRPVRLMLDSGTNAPVLYNTGSYMSLPLSQTVLLRGSSVDGGQRIFSALPIQDVKIGPAKLAGVPFYSLSGLEKDPRAKGFDGVLATELFRTIFIDHAHRLAVLQPR